jgi:hypothetical protein
VDAATAPELKEPLITEKAQGAENGVCVDAEDGRQVAGGRQAFAWFGFTVGDGAADFGGDLLEQVGVVLAVDLDGEHGMGSYGEATKDCPVPDWAVRVSMTVVPFAA